ncbi:MAG: hypothetical protein QUS14_11145 [Pyrinomonadaceae bacterium]|nr:hypothetical protein [Pyrinomonadaceae bacterium]
MKSILGFGVLAFALAFCGLGDRLKQMQGGAGDSGSASNSSSPSANPDAPNADKAEMTASQRSIADGGTEIKWDDQGISWKVPPAWKKMDVKKESLNYGNVSEGFLIASISVMPDSFPSDISAKATYDSALEQMKQGKYEEVRWLDIDGVTGVEWIESMPEDKDGPRRHQWIAFRRYQGQNQQLNIMVSTKGSNFDSQRDKFAAILYSMKIPKG